ncbi:MAG: iron-sulfur cluster assembly accessory protein [Pseudoalteromonas tetraodonis]|jgi:iron-sulfur cluster assembly accessory protein
MITVHENAVKHLQEILSADGASEKGDGLRLLVERGGCAGMQYGMKIDHRVDGDAVFGEDGAHLYVDAESLKFLDGVELQYSDDLTDSGLKIVNPNAARSCGCGTSFEPKVAGEEPVYDSSQDGEVCGGGDAEAVEAGASAGSS